MSLYINGTRNHANSAHTYSVENHNNTGDKLNAHTGWEIIFGDSQNVKGVSILLEKRSYVLESVGALVYNGLEPHHEFYNLPHIRAEAIIISDDFLTKLVGEVLEPKSIHFSSLLARDSEFLKFAKQVYWVLRNNVVSSEEAEAATESLAVDLLEKVEHDKKEILMHLAKKASPRLLLKEILTEIHLNCFDDNFDLSQLAVSLGVTKFHIIRTMKAHFGCTPHAYIRRIRLHKARGLLTDTKLPITRIAFDCGFSDTSSLNKAFKLWTGLPPSGFR